MIQNIGDSLSSSQRHAFFALSRGLALDSEKGIRIASYEPSLKNDLCNIANITRGRVHVAAEELAGDVPFQALDGLYRRVGLRRTRHVWLAYRKGKEGPIGAAIAYRGPLGLNFSYLENRCDLLLHPSLSEGETEAAASSLLKASANAYENFELEDIPVIAAENAIPVLLKVGATFVRRYCQCIWLKDSYPRSYRHVDSFYSKVLVRAEKHGLQPTFAF